MSPQLISSSRLCSRQIFFQQATTSRRRQEKSNITRKKWNFSLVRAQLYPLRLYLHNFASTFVWPKAYAPSTEFQSGSPAIVAAKHNPFMILKLLQATRKPTQRGEKSFQLFHVVVFNFVRSLLLNSLCPPASLSSCRSRFVECMQLIM